MQPTAFPTASDARPPLGFRVGVTGHRDLGQADQAVLFAAIGRALDEVAEVIRELGRQPVAKKLYAPSAPLLRLISPLAEGADRLVAAEAVARGWQLAAPLPFAQAEYEQDFADSVEAFRALLAHARATDEVVELDGSRAAANDAYTEVGRFVIRHSDLLIAIWDGAAAAGHGGTGEIVAEARALGVPVWHIDATPPHTGRLLAGETEHDAPAGMTVAAAVRLAVMPEWPAGSRKHARAAEIHFVRERIGSNETPPDFLSRGPFVAPRSRLGRVFPAFMRALAGPSRATAAIESPAPPVGAENATVRRMYLYFQRADALATYYADLHRSAYVLIYLFGSLSLVAAFAAQFTRTVELGPVALGTCMTAAEAGSLIAILALVSAEHRWRWRERWLDYRTLSEMLRQSDLLAQIGGLTTTGCLDQLAEMHPERGWVPWLVAAITRSTAVVGARYDADYLARVRDYAARTRLSSQIAYHERTSARNARVSRWLRMVSTALFGFTALAIVSEFALGEAWPSRWFAFFAGIFPALGAASFGIRNQAEFEIVVHRSAQLHKRLKWERRRIEALVGERLTSVALNRAIQEGARIMLSDTAEWAAIFEVKESEVV